MALRIPTPIGLTALVYTLFSAGAGVSIPANIARADNCLTAPNSPTPRGSHWYYRMDWAKQRKCWYLRALAQPSQQAAPRVMPEAASAAPLQLLPAPSATSGDDAPSSAQVKMLSVRPRPAPMTSPTKDEPVGRSAQDGTAAPSISPALVPQANVPQSGAQPLGPAPAAGTQWPDPPAAIAVPAAKDSVVVSDDAVVGSLGPKADARMSGDSQGAGRHAASATAGAMPRSVTATPAAMFLPLALGLAAAGILSRIVMKLAAARRGRIIVDYAEPDWIDDSQLQPGFRDDRDEEQLTDQRWSDRRADFGAGRSQPPAASLRKRNAASAKPPSVDVEDLETTERVIMRALQSTQV